MRIYISHSASENIFAQQLKHAIKKSDDIIVASPDIEEQAPHQSSNSIVDIAQKIMKGADLLILLWSKKSDSSKWAYREAKAMKMLADVDSKKEIVVIAQDGAIIPLDLERHIFKIVAKFDADAIALIAEAIAKISTKTPKQVKGRDETPDNSDDQIEYLRQALLEGKLTLVCGAGVSIGAGIPTWNKLLDRLLEAMVKRLTQDDDIQNEPETDLNFIRESSSLIVGRYLKSVLRDDFETQVRDSLYADSIESCSTIDAIVELARPKRAKAHLDSIITFNFDDLLEKNLAKSHIDHFPIYSEGNRSRMHQLPIYHVHGYLPSKGKLSRDNTLVFSEDAYHDQFIDPFSWSNLTQLNKYSQNTCLFVGLSMTDPNLRRLLDVAKRRDKQKNARHTVVLKRDNGSSKSRMIENLREQDAASLGLSILWVDDFAQVAQIIKRVSM